MERDHAKVDSNNDMGWEGRRNGLNDLVGVAEVPVGGAAGVDDKTALRRVVACFADSKAGAGRAHAVGVEHMANVDGPVVKEAGEGVDGVGVEKGGNVDAIREQKLRLAVAVLARPAVVLPVRPVGRVGRPGHEGEDARRRPGRRLGEIATRDKEPVPHQRPPRLGHRLRSKPVDEHGRGRRCRGVQQLLDNEKVVRVRDAMSGVPGLAVADNQVEVGDVVCSGKARRERIRRHLHGALFPPAHVPVPRPELAPKVKPLCPRRPLAVRLQPAHPRSGTAGQRTIRVLDHVAGPAKVCAVIAKPLAGVREERARDGGCAYTHVYSRLDAGSHSTPPQHLVLALRHVLTEHVRKRAPEPPLLPAPVVVVDRVCRHIRHSVLLDHPPHVLLLLPTPARLLLVLRVQQRMLHMHSTVQLPRLCSVERSRRGIDVRLELGPAMSPSAQPLLDWYEQCA